MVLHCLARDRKFLVVAETRYAVQVCADTIKASLEAANVSSDRVFHLEHAELDDINIYVSNITRLQRRCIPQSVIKTGFERA